MKAVRIGIDAIFAGAMIAIGAIVFLNCPNRIVGAFLFSIGLISVMNFGFQLYTGKVGYIRHIRQLPYILGVLLMNGVGCLLMLGFPTSGAQQVWQAHVQTSLGVAFVKAIVCGILIYICVAQHKVQPSAASILITVIAIPAFILGGAEHSVADICFMLAARDFSLQSLLFILVVAAGNAVGSLVFSLWLEYREKLKTE